MEDVHVVVPNNLSRLNTGVRYPQSSRFLKQEQQLHHFLSAPAFDRTSIIRTYLTSLIVLDGPSFIPIIHKARAESSYGFPKAHVYYSTQHSSKIRTIIA